jgi:hypothetical protein
VKELSRDGNDSYKMIVGNKADLESQRVVTIDEARVFYSGRFSSHT